MARGKKVLKLRAQAKVRERALWFLLWRERDRESKWSIEHRLRMWMDSLLLWSYIWYSLQRFELDNQSSRVQCKQPVLVARLTRSCLSLCPPWSLFLPPSEGPAVQLAVSLPIFSFSLFFSLSILTEVQLQVPRHRCAACCHRQVLPCWRPRQRQGSYSCQKPNQDQSFHHPWNCLDLVGWQIPRQARRCLEDSCLWLAPCLW